MPPLMERELQVALRKNAAWARVWTAAVGVLLALVHIVFVRHAAPGAQGQDLFRFLFLIASVKAAFETVRFSIDLISVERRNGTLGLLILTGLSSGELLLSKLGGALLVQLFNELALLPCFAIAFVIGGVPSSAFLAAAVFLPSVTILALTISLAASSLSEDADSGVLLAAAFGWCVGGAGPVVHYLLVWMGATPRLDVWLIASPVYGFEAIWQQFRTVSPAAFAYNTLLTLLWAILFAATASLVVRQSWREPGVSRSRMKRRSFLNRLLRARQSRRQTSIVWLEENPFVWLVLRDTRAIRLGWFAVNVVAACWGGAVLVAPRAWGNLLGGMLAVVVMGAVVGLLAMFSAARRVAEDRRGGGLELLLTTPLSVEAIIRGLSVGLWVAYRPLLRWSILLSVAVASVAAALRDWTVLESVIGLESWVVVACLVVISVRSQTVAQVAWVALNSGRPFVALVKVVCPPMVLVAFAFFIYSAAETGWPLHFPQGTLTEFWFLTPLVLLAALLAALAGRWDPGPRRLKENFRWVAQRPVPEPSDPRWWNWDITKPFPERSGRAIFSGQ